MLAAAIHMMQGTPYIYQGEEFGMTDPKFNHIDEYRDVETHNYYKIMKEKGMSEEAIMEIIKAKSRDNSRTPVQWDNSKNAGFTTGTPWINVADNYKTINAQAALEDENSIFYFYQALIKLRKDYEIITTGDYTLLTPDHDQVFAYLRTSGDEKLLVVNNFYGKETTYSYKEELSNEEVNVLLSNYDEPSRNLSELSLRPYESIVFHITGK